MLFAQIPEFATIEIFQSPREWGWWISPANIIFDPERISFLENIQER